MLAVEDHYYKLNRILLKVLGIWPYQKSKWKYVEMVIITILYISAIFVQLAVLITNDCTFELLINVLSFALPSVFTFSLYYVYNFNTNLYKTIMEHIYYDWKSFKSKVELDILDDYACTAKLLTKIFTFSTFIMISDIILVHIMPLFLDVILPLNESRSLHLYIKVEYFVNQSKYMPFLVVHMSVFLCIWLLTALAVASTLYSYGLHACGMFKLINYRMKVTMDKDVLRIPNPEQERIILKRLVCTIDLHRRNLLFCNILMNRLERVYFVLIIPSVASLSICMFRFMQAIMARDSIMEISISFGLFLIQILFIFFGNHCGQQITNNNAEIFDTVYNLQWYVVSRNIQKFVLFLLQKGNKDFHLSLGGMFDASYENFTKLITMAMSYFTVICSI